MSPDNHYLALIGFDAGKNKAGYLGIVNIDNRQTIVEQRASEQICHVEWLDNQKIIYTEFPDSQCNPYTEPGDTMIYDLQTNFSQKVNQAGEKLWLLQPPNVP
jgi:hypothetical protein